MKSLDGKRYLIEGGIEYCAIFFVLLKSKTPHYLYQEIPEQRTVDYNLRKTRYYEPNLSRTIRFSISYFSNILDEWNKLDKAVQGSPSISVFKRNLLQIIRPIKHPVYNISDIQGVKMLTRLRVKFSPLKEHRFRHSFECLSPECICGAAIENTEHYLLHCTQLCTLRQTLLGQISDAGFDIANMSTEDLCCLLLYGRPNGSTYINRMILEATISFIKSSKKVCVTILG